MTRVPLADQDLHRAILKRLEWAPEIAAEHVLVAVRDAVVTLSGEAFSPAEKKVAVRTAAEVQGVTAVIDEIVVRDAVGTVDDTDIVTAMTDVLAHHPRLADQPISATVQGQVVTLSGMVDSPEEQLAARRVAQAVLGVRAVVEHLTLPPAPTRSQAQARLAEVLGGQATGGAPQVDIHLTGHVATLEGNVHSWYERRMAERAARSVPGVTEVENKLVVIF